VFLAATQGPDESDILSLPTALDLDSPLSTDVRGIRVALSVDLGAWAVDPEVEAAVRSAADALASAGAIVTEVDPGFSGQEEVEWYKLWCVFMAAYYGDVVEEYHDKMSPDVLFLIERGQSMSAVEYKQVEFARTRMWEQMRPILERNEVLLCPTMSTGPIAADSRGQDHKSGMIDGRYHSPDMTALWNMISPCPVLSVPCGLDGDAMPVGAQFVGRRWQEDRLLQVGRGLEATLGLNLRPPAFAS